MGIAFKEDSAHRVYFRVWLKVLKSVIIEQLCVGQPDFVRLLHGMACMLRFFMCLKYFEQPLVLVGKIKTRYAGPCLVFALAEKGDITQRAGGGFYFGGCGAPHEFDAPIDQRP